MAHQPHRPFESLEWYREAARNNFRDDNQRSSFGSWASGFGMLHTHIGVFGVSIVLMLLVNLLRDPEDIWADKWIMAWTVLLLIHAVAAGILWAVQQWNSDAPDEALQMSSPPEWEQAPTLAWGPPNPDERDAQDVDFRIANGSTAPEATDVSPAGTPGWTGWNADGDTRETPPSERASWKEASAGAWLNRSKPSRSRPEPPPEPASPDASE
jgi:hypothetical protein